MQQTNNKIVQVMSGVFSGVLKKLYAFSWFIQGTLQGTLTEMPEDG